MTTHPSNLPPPMVGDNSQWLIQRLLTELDTSKLQNNKIEQNVEKLNETINLMRQELVKYTQKQEHMKDGIDDINRRLTEYSKRVGSFKEDTSGMKVTLDNIFNKISEITAVTNKNVEVINKHTEVLQRHKGHIDKIYEKQRGMVTDITTIDNDLTVLRGEMDAKFKQIDNFLAFSNIARRIAVGLAGIAAFIYLIMQLMGYR